jgi:hypothetical protein
MADIATTLTLLGNAVKVVRDLNQIDREYDKAELKLKIAELSGALANAQMTLSEAQQELNGKDAEIAKLRKVFEEKQTLVEYNGFHYRKRADGSPQGTPYCRRCLQEGKLFLTSIVMKTGRPMACPECKAEYQMASDFDFEK